MGSLPAPERARALLHPRAVSDIVSGNRARVRPGVQQLFRGPLPTPRLAALVDRIDETAENGSGYTEADHARLALGRAGHDGRATAAVARPARDVHRPLAAAARRPPIARRSARLPLRRRERHTHAPLQARGWSFARQPSDPPPGLPPDLAGGVGHQLQLTLLVIPGRQGVQVVRREAALLAPGEVLDRRVPGGLVDGPGHSANRFPAILAQRRPTDPGAELDGAQPPDHVYPASLGLHSAAVFERAQALSQASLVVIQSPDPLNLTSLTFARVATRP
jgi:hypothetical protein